MPSHNKSVHAGVWPLRQATTMATLQAQAALRLELSRAPCDELDREFAVETRRIFLGRLRAAGAAPSAHRARVSSLGFWAPT